MKVLITGAAGFLGQGLVAAFEQAEGYALRLMDVRPFESWHEVVVGAVEDLACVRAAMQGVDAMVIAHMAPRNPDAYADPPICFDVNVKGTANLFFAAQEAGVRRVVLISSVASVNAYPAEEFHTHDLTPKAMGGHYPLTKALQEIIAEQYAREYGMAVAVLRMGHIVDLRAKTDKYGKAIVPGDVNHTDRRDIGEVARRCLELPDLHYETFYITSLPDGTGAAAWDLDHTFARLKWRPRVD